MVDLFSLGAVDKGIMAEIRPNGTDTVMLYSIDLKDRVEFKVNDPEGPRAIMGTLHLWCLPGDEGIGR